MIVVKVELWPGGSEAGKRKLAEMRIVKDGESSTRDLADYNIEIDAEYTSEKFPRKVRVENFRRLKQSVWTLIGAALKGANHTKHPPAHIKTPKDQPELFD